MSNGKKALILNGNVEGATRVFVDGKPKEGFTGTAHEGGKIVLLFGEERVTVTSLSTENVSDYAAGLRVVDTAFGRTRTILTKGAEGVTLGGPNGRNLKAGNVEVSYDDLARNYIPAQYAGNLASSVEQED